MTTHRLDAPRDARARARPAVAVLAVTVAASSVLPCVAAIAAPAAGAARPITPRGEFSADERSTIALFERARESVVYITTRERVQDLFSRNVFTVPRGTGSGFVWDESGHIVTNFHVIEGASEATVKLADGRDFRATLVGASAAYDVAVLRIATGARAPRPVPIGSSADLRVGQRVYAIGNPFGLDWTLTTGIVSALNRSLAGESGAAMHHLIQTDAAINPGNSGGPLLDSAGRLIGVNTAIYSPSGASAGIGFAVPVDTVNRVVPQLIRDGRYVRPTLGIELDEGLNRRLAALLGVQGVVVVHVAPGSSAARAGLRGASVTRSGALVPGDVIVGIDGQPVRSVDELLARLDDRRVGEAVRLELLRGRERVTVTAVLDPERSGG